MGGIIFVVALIVLLVFVFRWAKDRLCPPIRQQAEQIASDDSRKEAMTQISGPTPRDPWTEVGLELLKLPDSRVIERLLSVIAAARAATEQRHQQEIEQLRRASTCGMPGHGHTGPNVPPT